jgi:hypothetical protein
MATKKKLSPAERKKRAKAKMFRAQARTGKRLKEEKGETPVTGRRTQLKRKGSFAWQKGEGKYAYEGDTTYDPKTRKMIRVAGKRKRKPKLKVT